MLIPEDFPLATLANDAERTVVRALRDGLSDGWLILPDVGIRGRRDFQLDVVAVHRDFGVLDLEVKGHRVSVRNGVWCSGGSPLQPQPFQQARDNAYALRGLLRERCDLPRLEVEHGVAFPNSTELCGSLPPDVHREQLLLGPDLDDVQDSIERLMLSRSANQVLTQDAVESIVGALRPHADFSFDPLARAASARARLDDVCEEHVRALAGLDVNRRVAVSGAAGTGKSRLAAMWATRAFHRGERVLLTCYNEPLAAELRDRLPDDESFRVGAFLTTSLSLEGMEPLVPPPDAGDEWWNVTAVGHLLRHWHRIDERFDTIVIDEAQDFSPAWIAELERLLDVDGPRRLLLVADEQQILYERGFTMPSPEDGWTRCRLLTNCRNTYEIARLLRRRLNGAPSPMTRPESFGVRWVEADGVAHAVPAVRAELARIDSEVGEVASVLVETTASSVREALRSDLGLVRWEERGKGRVVCENVHRVKGLEVDTVIFVCPTVDVDDTLLYIGLSRAVMELVVVSPRAIAERLGLV